MRVTHVRNLSAGYAGVAKIDGILTAVTPTYYQQTDAQTHLGVFRKMLGALKLGPLDTPITLLKIPVSYPRTDPADSVGESVEQYARCWMSDAMFDNEADVACDGHLILVSVGLPEQGPTSFACCTKHRVFFKTSDDVVLERTDGGLLLTVAGEEYRPDESCSGPVDQLLSVLQTYLADRPDDDEDSNHYILLSILNTVQGWSPTGDPSSDSSAILTKNMIEGFIDPFIEDHLPTDTREHRVLKNELRRVFDAALRFLKNYC